MGRHLSCFVPVLLLAAGCGGHASKSAAPMQPSMSMPVQIPPPPSPSPPAEPVADGPSPSEAETIVVTGSAVDRRELNTSTEDVIQSVPAPAPSSLGAAGAQVAAPATQVLPEQLVVQGAISLVVDDPEATARALRAEVERLGGRIVSEQVDGAAESWRAQIRLRLLPSRVVEVEKWLERHGEIVGKRLEATDVSRILFDQELALTNLTMTLDRLRKLLDGGGLSMQDILGIEREMTRLRGEIERIKGEKRYLQDRVALATIDIHVSRREGVVLGPRTKVYPGPRLVALTLFDPEGRQRTRLGGGFAMHFVIPRLTLEIDVFDDVEASADGPAEGHAVIATYGGAMYSDFLGRGQRQFLNPFLGVRLGYAHLDYHAGVVQGEVGLELFKHKYVMLDASVRATAFINDERVDVGLVSGASLVFAF